MNDTQLAELIIDEIEAQATHGCAAAERLGINPTVVDVAQHALRCMASRESLSASSKMIAFRDTVSHGNSPYEKALKQAAQSVVESAAKAAVIVAAIDMAINSHAKASAQKAN